MKTVVLISLLSILTLDGMSATSSAQDIVTLASRVSASGGGKGHLAAPLGAPMVIQFRKMCTSYVVLYCLANGPL